MIKKYYANARNADDGCRMNECLTVVSYAVWWEIILLGVAFALALPFFMLPGCRRFVLRLIICCITLHFLWLVGDIICFYMYGFTSISWRAPLFAAYETPTGYSEFLMVEPIVSGRNHYSFSINHKLNGTYCACIDCVYDPTLINDRVEFVFRDGNGNELLREKPTMSMASNAMVIMYNVPKDLSARTLLYLDVYLDINNDLFYKYNPNAQICVKHAGWK